MAIAIEKKSLRAPELSIWKIVVIQGLATVVLSYICLVKGYGILVMAFFGALAVGLPILFQPKFGLLLGIALNLTSVSAIFLGGLYMGVVAVTIAAWILWSLAVKPTFLRTPQNQYIYAFTAIVILSLISAADLKLGFESLGIYLKVVVLYFLIVNIANTPRFLRAILWVITLSALSVSLYGLYEFVSAPPIVGVLNRIASTRGDPNNLALTLVSVIPLTIGLFKIERQIALKAILALTSAVIFFTVPLTLSRGGFLALITILFLLVTRSPRKRTAILVLLLFVGIALLILPVAVWERARTVGISSMEASARMRMQLLKGGFEMFFEHPLLGVGIGNFITHSFNYSGIFPPQYAHNMFLHIAAETGILGLLFFVAILYITWRMLRQMQKSTSRNRDTFVYQISQGLEISLVSFCVAAFFLSQHFNKMLWILIALTGCVNRLFKSKEESVLSSNRLS